MGNAGGHGNLLAKVPAQVDDGYVRVVRLQPLHYRERAVRAAVIHEHDLVVQVVPGHYRIDASHELVEPLFLVIGGSNDGDEVHILVERLHSHSEILSVGRERRWRDEAAHLEGGGLSYAVLSD